MASSALPRILSNTSPARLPSSASLTGTHVTLEKLHARHMSDLYAAVGGTESIWYFMIPGPFGSLSEFEAFLRKAEESTEDTIYAILLNSSTKAVGIASLSNCSLANRVVEVGLIYGADLQRTRAGTEVLLLLGELVFTELGYRRLEWRCHSLNLPSKRAAERYGLVYEGTLRQHMIVKGRNRDTCVYSIVDSEWPLCKRVTEMWLDDQNFDIVGRQKRSMAGIRGEI
ncbi:GNAT family acetyltransferase [Usnea florida]